MVSGMPSLVRLATVMSHKEVLFSAASAEMPGILVHTNRSSAEVRALYSTRRVRSEPIILGRLPAGSMMCGGDFQILVAGGMVVAESLAHALRRDPARVSAAIAAARDPMEVDDECVSLMRYGHGTWGHWLGEILPTAAIVERMYPGRFKYAIPLHRSEYGLTMRESLRAYGIELRRVLLLPWTETIKMNNAWAVTRVWSWEDDAPHPAALDVMRGSVRLAPWPTGLQRVALMRRDWPTRQMRNGADVEEILRNAGFTITDAGRYRFVDQVRMFQAAKTVFGVLGSGLTGLIYSPKGVTVLAVGPSDRRDRFFHALAQHRSGRWLEVCGPSLWDGQGASWHAPFEVPLSELEDAVDRLSD
jgi:hypothetical protein